MRHSRAKQMGLEMQTPLTRIRDVLRSWGVDHWHMALVVGNTDNPAESIVITNITAKQIDELIQGALAGETTDL